VFQKLVLLLKHGFLNFWMESLIDCTNWAVPSYYIHIVCVRACMHVRVREREIIYMVEVWWIEVECHSF
jgi:hypothetical protein